jgi:hypothetical protein
MPEPTRVNGTITFGTATLSRIECSELAHCSTICHYDQCYIGKCRDVENHSVECYYNIQQNDVQNDTHHNNIQLEHRFSASHFVQGHNALCHNG